MDFFRLNPPPDPARSGPSGDRDEYSPDRRFMVCTRFSKNLLNSIGASSGCTFAGTQNSLEGSSSSSPPVGATVGMSETPWNDGRSGSLVLPTSIDIRRKACKLLSSWATAAGVDS
jgi:hypothetical protein